MTIALRSRHSDAKLARVAGQPLFEGLSRADLRRISSVTDECEVLPRATLIRQGAIGQWFFVIRSGTAHIIADGRRIGFVGPGQFFGELALIGGGRHRVTVRARTTMTVFVIRWRELTGLIDSIPALRRRLAEAVLSRSACDAYGFSGHAREPQIDRVLERLQPRARRPIDRARNAARFRAIAWAAAAVTALAICAAIYHPPLLLAVPGPTADVASQVAIRGVRLTPVNGSFLLTTVRYRQPTVLAALFALAVRHDRLEPLRGGPHDRERDEASQRADFRQSRMLAAAAAARAAGLPVRMSGTGARVIDGPSVEGPLRPGDVIVGVDATAVRTASDLEDALAAGPAGSSFGLRVERSGETLELNVSSAPSDLEGAPSLGVALETRDLQVGLPFEISFRDQDIAGPSAGLAFGLAIYDMLSDTDIARGRTIAATGRLDPSGWVGPVGGVKEKALAAQHAGASLFVVPGPQVIEAWAQDVPVRGASTLRRALALLGRDAR